MSFQEITQFERKLYNNGIKYVAGIDEVGRGPLAGPFVVSAVILNLEKIFSPNFQELIKNIDLVDEKMKKEGLRKGEKGSIIHDKEKKPEKDKREYIFEINDVQYTQDDIKKHKLYTQIKDSKKVTPKRRDILANFIKEEAISYSIETFEPEYIDKFGLSELTQRAFFGVLQKLKVKPQYVLTDTFEIVKITKEHQLNIVSGDNKSISIASASIVAKVFRDNMMVEMHKKYPVYGFDCHKGYGTKRHMDALCTYGPCEIHRKSFDPVKRLLEG